MTNGSLAPELNPDDQIQFVESHRVALFAGDYTISATQTVTLDGQVDLFPAANAKFSIASARFAFGAQDIHAVFPPAGSRGQFDSDLPHVILNRSTLPWERAAVAGSNDPMTATPWLALLVFNQAEAEQVSATTVKLSALKTPGVGWPGLGGGLDSGQHEDDQCVVIDVPWTLLSPLLPNADGLNLCTHARRRLQFLGENAAKSTDALKPLAEGRGYKFLDLLNDKDFVEGKNKQWRVRDRENHQEYRIWQEGAIYKYYRVDREVAIVLSNRLPTSNQRNVVHLVSLESRFTAGKFDNGNSPTVRLVSLYHWEFYSVDPAKSFVGLLENLKGGSSGTFSLPIPPKANGQSSGKMLEAGFVPLRHRFREGSRSISWYHGPLVPGELGAVSRDENIAVNESADPVHEISSFGINLPANVADKLLFYDQTTRMFDVSYAAAWELGRMLTLANSKVAWSLYEWKRQHSLSLHGGRALADYGYDLSVDPASNTPDDLPADVARWLDDLTLLVHLPFSYLVPNAELLPTESLRFFTVDRVWLECLRDGAFSIGRVLPADATKDQVHLESLKKEQPIPSLTGFLLRSEVVTGFPDLRCDGFGDTPARDKESDAEFNSNPLRLIRMETLGPGVLLGLFEGQLKTLDIHLRPESLHFGFDQRSPLEKSIRDAEGNQASVPKVTASETNGVVDFTELAKKLEERLHQLPEKSPLENNAPMNAAVFALEMIAGVPLVRFIRD